jgi:Fe-S oxidoreductase
MKKNIQKCENDMDQYVVSCKTCYGMVNSQIKYMLMFQIVAFITNLLGFISLYKFCVKSNLHRFIQKSHEFHVMVNMNDICTYSIS